MAPYDETHYDIQLSLEFVKSLFQIVRRVHYTISTGVHVSKDRRKAP